MDHGNHGGPGHTGIEVAPPFDYRASGNSLRSS
jgi:hypothetical protein